MPARRCANAILTLTAPANMKTAAANLRRLADFSGADTFGGDFLMGLAFDTAAAATFGGEYVEGYRPGRGPLSGDIDPETWEFMLSDFTPGELSAISSLAYRAAKMREEAGERDPDTLRTRFNLTR